MSELLDKPFSSVPGMRGKGYPSGSGQRAGVVWQRFDRAVGESHPASPFAPSGQKWAVRCRTAEGSAPVETRALWNHREQAWDVGRGLEVIEYVDPGHLDAGADDEAGADADGD